MLNNIDFVQYSPGDDTSWGFIIAGNAKKASEEFDEILGLSKKMFDITKGFYKPTKIIYGLDISTKDIPAYDILEFKTIPLECFRRELQSDEGIFFEDLIKDLGSTETNGVVKYIGGINFDEGKTKFVLRGMDQYIDRTSISLYTTRDYDLNRSPEMDPIRIRISHSRDKDEYHSVESSDPAYYQIIFSTYTNIWFEHTEIGLANRNRLRNVLKKIYHNFNVVDTLFLSDHISDDALKDVVFGNC